MVSELFLQTVEVATRRTHVICAVTNSHCHSEHAQLMDDSDPTLQGLCMLCIGEMHLYRA